MDSRRALGRAGEVQARAWLEAQGLSLIAQNWRPTGSPLLRGELDLVMRDGDTLVIVEVRTSTANFGGGPAYSLTPHKVRRLKTLGQRFRETLTWSSRAIRFDLIAIESTSEGMRFRWLKNVLIADEVD